MKITESPDGSLYVSFSPDDFDSQDARLALLVAQAVARSRNAGHRSLSADTVFSDLKETARAFLPTDPPESYIRPTLESLSDQGLLLRDGDAYLHAISPTKRLERIAQTCRPLLEEAHADPGISEEVRPLVAVAVKTAVELKSLGKEISTPEESAERIAKELKKAIRR